MQPDVWFIVERFEYVSWAQFGPRFETREEAVEAIERIPEVSRRISRWRICKVTKEEV